MIYFFTRNHLYETRKKLTGSRIINGDLRCDTPRFCATKGVYIFQDYCSKPIVGIENVILQSNARIQEI